METCWSSSGLGFNVLHCATCFDVAQISERREGRREQTGIGPQLKLRFRLTVQEDTWVLSVMELLRQEEWEDQEGTSGESEKGVL